MLSGEEGSVSFSLPLPVLYYSWHRMIYLIGNPNALPPRSFLLAMQGIAKLVDCLLSMQTTALSFSFRWITSEHGPEGNTILHMFGPWLFEASAKSDSRFEEGRAIALGALCRIFCTRQRLRPFLPKYLERFYATVFDALHSEFHAVKSVITNCETLFAAELEGARVLVPDFVLSLKSLLSQDRFGFLPKNNVDEIRLSAARILVSLLPLANHYSLVSLSNGPTELYVFSYKESEAFPVSSAIESVYARVFGDLADGMALVSTCILLIRRHVCNNCVIAKAAYC